MPIREKVIKSELTGTLDDFLSDKKREKAIAAGKDEGDTDFLNIIEFIDRFNLLPQGLFPVQRFIVKLYYNIPLDDKLPDAEKDRIKITDKFGQKVLREMSELEYLHFLYDHGRCNIREQDGRDRRELILVIGRRSGKSMLSSIFAAYEMYKLLRRGHPQSYYGAPSGNEIRVLCVANDKEQASIVYGEMLGHVEAVDYFKSSVANSTQTYIKFRTDNDKKKYGDNGKATIMATFKSSIAKGLRGRGIICAILDEIAFFVDDGKSSAERVYKAIVPSIAQFSPKDPKNKHKPIGPSDGRVILISSPDAREGFFYRSYQIAMSNSKASENMLMVQAPTWEVNPTLSADYYEVEYHKDPRSFMTEHGAEFSDRVRGWIEDYKDLASCIVPELRPQVRGYPRESHFAGFDLGLSNDGSCVALTRLHGGRIELVYHEIWYPRVRWKDSNPHLDSPLVPYALTLQDRNRLDLAEVAEWLLQLSKRFYIIKGTFDQWTGMVLEQELHKRGLTQFEMKNFFTTHSSQIYQVFKSYMYQGQVALYDYPVPLAADGSDATTMRHSPLIAELLELQAKSGGKNIVVVEAPDAPGKHDDQSDALARSIFLASEHIQAHPGILEASKTPMSQVASGPVRTPGYHQFHRNRARLHGGSSPERQVPRGGRGGGRRF